MQNNVVENEKALKTVIISFFDMIKFEDFNNSKIIGYAIKEAIVDNLKKASFVWDEYKQLAR